MFIQLHICTITMFITLHLSKFILLYFSFILIYNINFPLIDK